MMSANNRKPSELDSGSGTGGAVQRPSSEVTLEKSFSEVSGSPGSDESQSRDVPEMRHAVAEVQYAATFTEADDEVSARRPQPHRTSTCGDEQAAEMAAAKAYVRDRGSVRALAHTQLAACDRSTVDAWLDKLDGCGDPEVRSQYAEFLLRTVAGGSMRVQPFCDRPPPDGPLRRLGLRVADPALLWHNACRPPPPIRSDSTAQRGTPTTRETFYGRQPIPEDGTICYAAAFSDMS